MPGRATIVMYHFVRDVARSRYPRLKALELSAFREQLAYIRRHYTIIGMRALAAALDGADLPPRACLLTFDDGYLDHYTNVFPLLDELGLEGSFFPPVDAIRSGRVLEVNKIHFILASTSDVRPVTTFLTERLESERDRYGLPPVATLVEQYGSLHRSYDPPEVNFVKRLLQRGLPEPLRGDLVDELFSRFVTSDEAAFARELYVSEDQLRCMVRHGMVVGSHGCSHAWLDTLDRTAQEREIVRSIEFLGELGVKSDWVMCYPYGGYDGETLDVVRAHGARLGLGCQVGIADLDADDRLVLPRLDTNDLPHEAQAPENEWTRRADLADGSLQSTAARTGG